MLPLTQSEDPPADASAESAKGQSDSQKGSTESDKNKKPKKSYRHVDLPIHEITTALTKQEINGLFEKEVCDYWSSMAHPNALPIFFC